MSTIVGHQNTRQNPSSQPRLWHWTVAQYNRLGDQGVFGEQRVELLEGRVVLMPAMKDYHLAAIDTSAHVLDAVFGPGYWVRRQGQLDLLRDSAPMPDIALVPGSAKGSHRDRENPSTALLIVEVSLSTLHFDRGQKLRIYAKAGIPESWILNLDEQQLEVYRQPQLEPGRKRRFRYAQVTILKPTDRVSPLAAPNTSILVSDMLP